MWLATKTNSQKPSKSLRRLTVMDSLGCYHNFRIAKPSTTNCSRQ